MARRPSPPPTWALVALAALAVVALSAWSLAACGPWDPWETHYGEVARQIVVRDDPLDLWWRPGTGPDGNAENTFWSKPALPFWLMALSMKLLGVGAGAAPDEMVRSPWPELAIRLPSMLAGLLCAAFLGWAVYRVLAASAPEDRRRPARAGLFTALALCTMPQWAIVSRQALTDMFFVAPVAVAMGAWALAWLQPDRPLRRRALASFLPRRLRDRLAPTGLARQAPEDMSLAPSADAPRSTAADPPAEPASAALAPPSSPGGPRARGRLDALLRRELPWDRVYAVFLVALAVAALAPLAMLHEHVISDRTVARVAKFVKKPGVPNFDTLVQIHRAFLVYWLLALAVLLRTLAWRTRAQAWMGVLYLAAGVSLIGKGLIGPGLVGLLVLMHLVVGGQLGPRALWRCGLGTGLVLFALASLPWHHAMWLYRGDRWFNELIVVNNLARFGSGEQEQAVGGFGYYLRTLGIAALPWSAALPAALWAAARRLRGGDPVPTDRTSGTGPFAAWSADPAGELWRFALLWFAVSLALLTYSVTKYYHYLLPALPPLAVLVGLWLSEVDVPRDRKVAWVAAGLGGAILALVLRDVIVEPAWIAHLTTYLYDNMWRSGAPPTDRLVVWCAPFLVGLGLWAARAYRLGAAAMLLSALLTLNYTLNSYLPGASDEWSQRAAIRHYYDHRGPDDPLASWWFYYRGETFLTKAQVWVSKEAERDPLVELIDANRGQGRSLWLITTGSHARRTKSVLPSELRAKAETVYENHHYMLIRVPLP